MRVRNKYISRTFTICVALIISSSFCGCSTNENKRVNTGSDEILSYTGPDTESNNTTVKEELDDKWESTVSPESPEVTEPRVLRLGFAGDLNLDENWATTQYLNTCKNGIMDCIDPKLIDELAGLDIFMVNNEFTYSTRGIPTPNKLYTFRADPSRVNILEQLGTDIVLLANNHVYDYGEDAFRDTIQVLQDAGISYVGAGMDLEEACTPCYYDFDGIKIAYVAATKAEKNKLTPEASEDSPGVLRCYDPELFLKVIEEADQNADYVIANVHFGTEYEPVADESQRELAYRMIDAGADAVIGSIAHVLQGIEFYKDKPIVYNLGNFWFNSKDLYSCVVELELQLDSGTDGQRASFQNLFFLPCTQYDCYTKWCLQGDEREKILNYEESLSFGVTIDEQGVVRRREE